MDSNHRCFFVADLQSAAFATRLPTHNKIPNQNRTDVSRSTILRTNHYSIGTTQL